MVEEEKKTNPVAALMAKHGEKIALGACILALAAYAVMGVMTAKPDKSADDLRKRNERLADEKKKEHSENLPAEYKSPVPAAIGPWNEVSTAKSAHDWVATFTPKLVPEVVEPPKPTITDVLVPTMSPKSPESAIDGVTVEWSVKTYSKEEMADIKKEYDKKSPKRLVKFMDLSRFTLERKTDDAGKWEMLNDKLPTTQTVYRDDKTQPRAKYFYRITSYCEDKEYKKAHAADEHRDGMVETIEFPAVVTKGIWQVTFKNPMDKKRIYVQLEKYDREHGKVVISHIHQEGDKIGWWTEKDSPEPVSKHAVSKPGGGQVIVDFNSGMTLDIVKDTSLEVLVQRCKPKFEGGTKVGCDTVPDPRVIKVTLVSYTDEIGEKHEILSPDPRENPIYDQRCPEHRKGNVPFKILSDEEAQERAATLAPPEEEED